ncbi:MAG TPA: CGNR zinc finger domain-containing protein [Candidatus Limnocylindrales bacterium]|nr:CGNR zinc finger domain-containing protein [Candidatus Limnocylindrales bacterium]
MTAATPSSHHASGDHHHETSLEDSFDFMNTIELESGSLVERLVTFDDAANWLLAHGVVHGSLDAERLRSAFGDEVALARVRAVRGALREIAHAIAEDRPADGAALTEINRAIQARERIELVPEPGGCSVGHSHVGDPLDDALARLADPIVDAIQAGHTDRVRICANDTCRWIFFDESRAGRRRWCDMATCGNRAKAARHRARQKASEVEIRTEPEAPAAAGRPN